MKNSCRNATRQPNCIRQTGFKREQEYRVRVLYDCCDDDWDSGKVDGQFSQLVGGSRVRFLMRSPYCTLDRRTFGLRMIELLLALSTASLPRTYECLSSLMSVNCVVLRPPATMIAG